MSAEPGRDACEKRLALLRSEVEQRIGFYRSSRNANRTAYYGFLILSLICSFSASTIAALSGLTEATRPALVTLPLVATFCTYLIRQFSWREVYQLREQGRIDAMELEFLVRRSDSTVPADVARLEETVYEKLTELSRKQAGGFFSFTKGHDERPPQGQRKTEASRESLSS
jgi:hypothetical protein